MNEETKDLAYFKQQVGIENYKLDIDALTCDELDEAAELYAAYKFGQAAERYAIQFNIGLNEYERAVIEKIQDPIEVSDLFLGFPNADSYESDLILNICCKLFNATFAK